MIKGQTLYLKVLSSNAIDIRIYVKTNQESWVTQELKNKKLGDITTTAICYAKPTFKIYTRPSGGSGDWPKP
jgi:hypothetical protein